MPDDSLVQVRGFQVRYQAIGSHVVQYSNVLSSSTFSHYITRLHENTAYDVCVNVYTADEVSPPRRSFADSFVSDQQIHGTESKLTIRDQRWVKSSLKRFQIKIKITVFQMISNKNHV